MSRRKSKAASDSPAWKDLFSISARVLSMGELIKFQNKDASPHQECVNYGVGDILIDLGEKLDAIFQELDEHGTN